MRPEAHRTEHETAFTPILRRLLHRHEGILAVVFVDQEGESVDYCSRIEAFDTKVAAAYMRIWIEFEMPRHGLIRELSLVGTERSFATRRVTVDYVLGVVSDVETPLENVQAWIADAGEELRGEMGAAPPEWESHADRVLVETRAAVGWGYAPIAFGLGDRRVIVIDVLGQWADGAFTCFRVRTSYGEELTLAHHAGKDYWVRK